MHSLCYDEYELDLDTCAVLEMKLFRVSNGIKLLRQKAFLSLPSPDQCGKLNTSPRRVGDTENLLLHERVLALT